MRFRIQCNNKGCCELTEAFVDQDTQQVFCGACNNEIKDVSPFFIRQMVQNKQFRAKEKKPFAIKCPACNAEDQPFLIDDEVVCSSCGTPMDHLTPVFKQMLKNHLPKFTSEQ